MRVSKVLFYLLVFLLLLSLIQVGFADLMAEEKPIKTKHSHFKGQIMKDQGLSRYDKIILLQMIHRKTNRETEKVFSKMACEWTGCNEMTCVEPEKWMDETRCQNMQLQVIIGAASTGGRAIGIPTIDPVIHLLSIQWARVYDYTKSQEDTRQWFGWGRVMRWYQ